MITYMANSVVSRFVDDAAKKRGTVRFDLHADGYNYNITFRVDAEGKWNMVKYTASLLK